MPTFEDSAAFAAIAADLLAEPDEDLTAQAIVHRLVALVPDAEEVSLTVRVRGEHHTLASSDQWATTLDTLQYELEEGPCLEASDDRQHAWIRSGEVGHDARWPRWGPKAAADGVQSLLAVQLLEGDRPVGALNLYSSQTGAFADRDTIDLASIYAVHAANALAAARRATHLETALSSRLTIGMAQGMLMERYGLSEASSFELLRRMSSTKEMKLREVAAFVVRERRLPDSVSGQDGANSP